MWESRRVAGNARAIALDFASDFLSVIKKEKYSIEVKMKEIAAYREVGSPHTFALHSNVAPLPISPRC